MFDKLKQFQQLNKIKDSISKERIEVEKNGIKVAVNGKMEIESIVLNPDLQKEDQERILKECINDAFKKIQMAVAQKLLADGEI